MASTLNDFLQPQVILDVVSRIRKGQGALGRWLGLHYTDFDEASGRLTGPSVHESPTRFGTYEIFDRTRTIAQARAPGTGPATWQPQPVGMVNYACCRFHEKIPLNAERLMNLAKIGGPNTVLDPGGQDYLTRQEEILAERFSNAIETMMAGVIRGSWYLQQSGDDWYPTLTQPGSGSYVTINQQIPAGNLGSLNMLGGGNLISALWDVAGTKIISSDLPNICDAYAQLTGYAITDAWTTPQVWGKIITNTEVINTAGSAATPFETFRYDGKDGSGNPFNEWVGVLRGYPTIRWHILSEYLVMPGGTDPSYSAGTGSLVSVIPPKCVTFTPPPSPEWIDLITYSEYVSEQPGMPMVKRPSPYFWSEWSTQPTAVELLGLMNAVPRLRIPKAIATPTVTS